MLYHPYSQHAGCFDVSSRTFQNDPRSYTMTKVTFSDVLNAQEQYHDEDQRQSASAENGKGCCIDSYASTRNEERQHRASDTDYGKC